MKPEQERVRNLLCDTVTLLCRNGLSFRDEIRVEGVIGITLDSNEVFLVHINECYDNRSHEVLQQQQASSENSTSSELQIQLSSHSQQDAHKVLLGEGMVLSEDSYMNSKAIKQEEVINFESITQESKHTMVSDISYEPPCKKMAYAIHPICEDSQVSSEVWVKTLSSDGNTVSTVNDNDQVLLNTEDSSGEPPMSSIPPTVPENDQSQPEPMNSTRSRNMDQKYPSNNLSSKPIKDSLAEHLVIPTVSSSCAIYACRMVWRNDNEEENDANWLDIVSKRLHIDSIIRALPGIGYFVSAITAIFNKPSRKGDVPKFIYPAVAYWIVSAGGTLAQQQLWGALQTACPNAEVRLLGRSAPLESQQAASSALHIVLKDHNSGYVRQRLVSSTAASELEPGSPGTNTAARFLANTHRYRLIILNALPRLLASKLTIDYDHADEVRTEDL